MMFTENNPADVRQWQPREPGLANASRLLSSAFAGSQLHADNSSIRGVGWGLPNKRGSLLFISQHIPDRLCLLADNRERRCFHFTDQGSLLPTCGVGGAPVC